MLDHGPLPVELLPPHRDSRGQFLWGLLAGAVVAGLVGGPLVWSAYRAGRARGAAVERERAILREPPLASEWTAPIPPLPPAPSPTGVAPQPEAGPPAEVLSAEPNLPRPRPDAPGLPLCLTALDCARLVWPMEFAADGPSLGRTWLRIRQGANRLAAPGTGLGEFVFRLDHALLATIYVRARSSDDCGNSFRFSLDGGPSFLLDGPDVYGEWLWVPVPRRFSLAPGLHRLTFQTSEDGMELDRIVIRDQTVEATEGLDGLAPTPAPAFETAPPAGAGLPEIGALSAQAFAPDSLVIGAGHRNRLCVWLRLNGAREVAGHIEVRSPRGEFGATREFHLDPARRVALLSWDLPLHPRRGYFVPVQVRVVTAEGCVHSQKLDFIRPLAWAFLGPFPDPGQQGLDLDLPPDDEIAQLSGLPRFRGAAWKVVEDGSCYDEFGVVDLNKVFGRPNEPWREGVRPRPEVAYAVTAIAAPHVPHLPLAFAGDDCVQVWLNGVQILRQDGNAPIETSRMVVGVELPHGRSVFVFKAPQSITYWQLLFEPAAELPYSHPDLLQALPVEEWQ